MANRKINELSVRTPSLTDLMIVGDPSTGYSFKATLAALNTLIDSSTSIGDLNGVVITSPTNGQALVYNGTNWVNQSISVPVTSVFGRTGAVVATEGDYSLDLLSDVTLTTPSSNQVLQYNGTAWVNATLTDSGITSLNGLTALSQTFATGSSGTDFSISSTTSTHTFNLPTASAVNRGALSSADWSTFNSKVGGSGTSGQVAYWTGTSSQSGSNNLFWDNANGRLGIGTTSPASSLQIASAATLATGIQFNNAGSTGHIWGDGASMAMRAGNTHGIQINAGSAALNSSAGGTGGFRIELQILTNTPLYTFTGDANTGIGRAADDVLTFYSGGERARFTSGGNLLLNQTTDSGQRLQVNGDVLFKGSGNTGGTTALTVQNSDGTNMLRVRSDNNILIGSASAAISTGNATNLNSSDGGILYFSPPNNFDNSGKAGIGISILSRASTASTAINSQILQIAETGAGYAPTSGSLTRTYFQINATINQTGGANGITRGLYVNPTLTAAADWRSIEWSNNSGWGLYGAGTANNYLAGSLGIGSTSLTGYNLRMSKAITGATTSYGMSINSLILSGVTADATIYHSFPSTQAASFTTYINHFFAQSTFNGAGSTIQEEMGFRANIGANSNAAFGFYGNVASGTGKWNLYMNGTADNYLAGNLSVGTTGTTAGYIIRASSGIYAQGNLRFDGGVRDNRDNTIISQSASGTTTNRVLTIANATYLSLVVDNANLLLGTTTDAGYKLDVNGTGRFSGIVNIAAPSSTNSTALTITNTVTATTATQGLSVTHSVPLLNYGSAVARFTLTASAGASYHDGIVINKGATAGHGVRIIHDPTGVNTSGGYNSAGVSINSAGNTYLIRAYTNGVLNTSQYFSYSNTINSSFDNSLSIFRARGTGGVPVLVSSGDMLGGIQFGAITGISADIYSQWPSVSAGIRSYATATPGGTNITSGDLRFYTADASAIIERARFMSDGRFAIGTTSPNASAILELSSTTKGFLPPKGTNAQMLAIASPVSGLVFYDTTNNKLNVYDGTNWVAVH